MFSFGSGDANIVNAIKLSQATIEFTLEGQILDANFNFLNLMGYELEEVKGMHHSVFVDPEEIKTREYARFWARLKAGEYFSAEFRRFAKDGREIWIQATYNPILNARGKPYKVFKVATDITERKEVEDGILLASRTDQLTGALNRRGWSDHAVSLVDDDSVDTVVLTYTLCSIDDWHAALAQMPVPRLHHRRHASAVLAASIFHFGTFSIGEAKAQQQTSNNENGAELTARIGGCRTSAAFPARNCPRRAMSGASLRIHLPRSVI